MKKFFLFAAIAAMSAASLTLGASSPAGLHAGLSALQQADTVMTDSAAAGTDSLAVKDSVATSDSLMKNYSAVITEDAETSEGLMTIHKVKSTWYLEIPDSLMGKPMLLASKISAISDNEDAIAGQMPEDPILVEWSKDDEKVYLLDISRQANYSATGSLRKGFKLNYMKPVMSAFPIKTVSPDSSAVVIDVTKFFCANERYMSPFAEPSALEQLLGAKSNKGVFKQDMSGILSSKAFPQNIVFKTRMVYTLSSEPFTAIMTVSMIRLADTPMKPRLSDHRIGYFTDRHTVYSENRDGLETVGYINRWNLQPKPEDMARYMAGELVEPEKPIVYYIDDAFPAKWRPYLKEGIEDWQRAFEKIGFKNAIVAKDYPLGDPDFDPDDIRYSCLRYASTDIANAMGPSWTDPRSGEIINGSVYFYHDVLKLLHNWRFVQTAAVDPAARKEVYDMDTMGPLLRYLVVHEVGHTLGLMHNMRGSFAYPVDSLRSRTFTDVYGTTASVMDYARYNYVAQPGDNVRWLLPPRLGPYDYFAIEWGYKPIFDAATPEDEKPVLNSWILAKGDDPMYRYGRQEIFTAIDPASQTESLGDDAIAASEYGISNLKIIMNNLLAWTAKSGEDYSYSEEMYKELLSQFNRYMGHVSKYIGGNYLEYPVYGDGKTTSFVPVDRKTQRAALRFVVESLKELPEWMENENIIKYFGPGSTGIYDYQASYVKRLLGFSKKVANTYARTEHGYSQYEYLEDLFDLVFKRTKQGKRLSKADMNMEYAFIYGLFDDLNLLKKSGSGLGFADDSDLFADDAMPCACAVDWESPELEKELEYARKESDASISNKEIQFYLLLEAKDLMNKKVKSGTKEMRAHYSYLAHEINKVAGTVGKKAK